MGSREFRWGAGSSDGEQGVYMGSRGFVLNITL